MYEREDLNYLQKEVKRLKFCVVVLFVIVILGGLMVVNDHFLLDNERQVVNWCADYLLNDGHTEYKQPVQSYVGYGDTYEEAARSMNYLVK